MYSTTQVITSIKFWGFFAIVAVSLVCAVIRYRALGARDGARSGRPADDRNRTAAGSHFSYVAKGTSPESQRRYIFDICKAYDGYRAYIVQSPSYGERDTDGHSTHRFYDGRYYICWDRPIESYDGMVAVAKLWSDCSQKYIEKGTKF